VKSITDDNDFRGLKSVINDRLVRYYNNERSFKDFKGYSLDHVRGLLLACGNPQNSINTIHIAGTNGKGSTAHFTADILIRSSYKTGLFTSPHLEEINERIKIDNVNISDDDLLRYLDIIESALSGNNIFPTYFDVLTVIAFLYFFNNHVDFAVIECGLGGRLDSTNVIIPLVSIITGISKDHEHILGNSIEKITLEKCGIIKKGVPVITGVTDDKVLSIIIDYAEKMESPLYCIGRDYFAVDCFNDGCTSRFSYRINDIVFENLILNMPAMFQVSNFCSAITTAIILRSLDYHISDEVLYRTAENSYVPGRLELMCNAPIVYFDPAHNEEALSLIISEIKRIYKGKELIVFFTLMKDKKPEYIIENIFINNIDYLYYINLPEPRAYNIESDNRYNITIVNSMDIKFVGGLLRVDAINLFTGSFRLYEVLKDVLRNLQ